MQCSAWVGAYVRTHLLSLATVSTHGLNSLVYGCHHTCTHGSVNDALPCHDFRHDDRES